MLIDEAEIILIAGHGGTGKVSFRPGKYGGPDGGNGGKGGGIFINATTDLMALRQFTTIKTLRAENGESGGKNRKFGKDGKDLDMVMPVGTYLKDLDTGEEFEIGTANDRLMVCEGGKGGKGNFEFKSSRNTTPEYAQPGLEGQKRHLRVLLKLIADFGLIGLPNAGKSSLLNELTRAQARVADYPFTTLEPNLGAFSGHIIADIPGLIEGAHLGKGLGVKFLKHIEKVGMLLHCISAESEDPLKDYQTVRKELEDYGQDITSKDEIMLITKSDLVDEASLRSKILDLRSLKKEIIPVSIHNWDSLENLKKHLLL